MSPLAERVSRERCNCFLICNLSCKISQLYDDTLAPSVLRGTQYSLMLNARKGFELAPASMLALAKQLNTDCTMLTCNLHILQDAGHIELVTGRDARSKCVQIAMVGEAALREAQTLWRKAQREMRLLRGDEPVDQLQQVALAILLHLHEVKA